ncbi:MAG: hypothetical protein AAF891_05895 [Pseudomonadota bacterium]
MLQSLQNMVKPTKTPGDVLAHAFKRVSLGIGFTALLLPTVAYVFGRISWLRPGEVQNSLSHFYYTPVMGDFFVGCLFFIGILFFFFFHTGGKPVPGWENVHGFESLLMRLAGILAIGIAIFPTGYPGTEDLRGEQMRPFFEFGTQGPIVSPDWARLELGRFVIEYHYVCAVLMFFILAYFTLRVFPRTQAVASLTLEGTFQPSKQRRNAWYRRLGLTIAASIVGIGAGKLLLSEETWNDWNGTFYFEWLALAAFGIAWLIKGRWFTGLND